MASLPLVARIMVLGDALYRAPPELGPCGLSTPELSGLIKRLDAFIDANGDPGAAASITYDLSDDWKAWFVDQVMAKRGEM